MEQLISDIERFCVEQNITPQKLLRETINASWGTWGSWKAGTSSPTMKLADRLRAHMACAERKAAAQAGNKVAS